MPFNIRTASRAVRWPGQEPFTQEPGTAGSEHTEECASFTGASQSLVAPAPCVLVREPMRKASAILCTSPDALHASCSLATCTWFVASGGPDALIVPRKLRADEAHPQLGAVRSVQPLADPSQARNFLLYLVAASVPVMSGIPSATWDSEVWGRC
jgi:hypothetical protein